MVSPQRNGNSLKTATATFVLAAACTKCSGRVNAFVVTPPTFSTAKSSLVVGSHKINTFAPTPRRELPIAAQFATNVANDEILNEVERLRSMAAKLRTEAAQLEADKANAMAEKAEKAFRVFDINDDGEVSVEELKAGLEKMFKLELSEVRAQELVDSFDSSGDGALQLDEFVNVEQFRNKLEQLVQDEKRAASEARKEALLQAEKEQEEVEAQNQRLEIINDKPPTTLDKALSLLPYLLPLLDGLPYGSFLLSGNDGSAVSNPVVMVLGSLFALYRSIPLSGFIAFTALSLLSATLSVNRLIRFNAQQAIYFDVALFLSGIVSALVATATGGSPALTEALSDTIFVAMLAGVAYASMSSLLGMEPDKVPFISQAVKDRMPTLDMFDEQGDFTPPFMRQVEDDINDDDDDDA